MGLKEFSADVQLEKYRRSRYWILTRIREGVPLGRRKKGPLGDTRSSKRKKIKGPVFEGDRKFVEQAKFVPRRKAEERKTKRVQFKKKTPRSKQKKSGRLYMMCGSLNERKSPVEGVTSYVKNYGSPKNCGPTGT